MHSEEWRALPTYWRGLYGAMHSKRLPSLKNTPLGYFVIITGPEGSSLYVCGVSSLYVINSEKARKILANSLALEEIIIPPNSVISVMITCNRLYLDG